MHHRPCTLEVIYSDDIHCLSMNLSSDEEDTFVTWLMRRRLKKDVRSTGFTFSSTEVVNLALLFQPQN
jgi:hypothetical protein